MNLRGVVVLSLSLGLAACATPEASPAPTVTVTQTITAAPPVEEPSPSPSPSTDPGEALSKYVYVACSAATQHAILSAMADSVYFEQRISSLVRQNTDWYLDVLREGAEMDTGSRSLPPEQSYILEQVAADFADQAVFVEDMKRTDDYYTWYDTWMAVVDDPAFMDSVQALLFEAGLSDCPLYTGAFMFG